MKQEFLQSLQASSENLLSTITTNSSTIPQVTTTLLRKRFENTTAVLQGCRLQLSTCHYKQLQSLWSLQVSWESHMVC
jgi:hypothetical protein